VVKIDLLTKKYTEMFYWCSTQLKEDAATVLHIDNVFYWYM